MATPSSGDYRAALTATVEDVDALSLQGADRAVALAVLLAARVGLGTVASMASPAPAGGSSGIVNTGPNERNTNAGAAKGDLVSQICAVTKLEREVAELIYDSNGTELSYVISAKRLAPAKSEATRQLAQIVALGRQAAELEEWTPSSAIREVVQEYGKFDSANFASHLQGLDKDNAVLFRGKGAAREVKVTRAGVESMADAVRALVAG